jgi:hypothetical protein
MALRQVDDRRLVEPFAGVGTSVEQLLDDPAEEIGAVGEPPPDTAAGSTTLPALSVDRCLSKGVR